MQFRSVLAILCFLLLVLALSACSGVPAAPPVNKTLPVSLSTAAVLDSHLSIPALPTKTATTLRPNSLPAATGTDAVPQVTFTTPTLATRSQTIVVHPSQAENFELLARLDASTIGAIQEVVWQPGTQNLLVQSARQLFLLEPMKGSILWSLPSTNSQLLFTPDGHELILVRENEIQRLDPASGEVRSSFAFTIPDGLYVLSPDGQFIASTLGGDITLLDLKTNQPRTLPADLNSGPVYDLAFSGDGKWVIAGSQNGDLQAWDVVAGQRTHFLPAAIPSPVYDCQVSGARDNQTTGALVIACSYPAQNNLAAIYKVGIYSANAGTPGSTLVIQDPDLNGYNSFKVNTERSRVAVLTGAGVEIWSATGGSRLRAFKSVDSQGMAFNPGGGSQLASWSKHAITIWNIYSGQTIAEWRIPDSAEPVVQLAFSPMSGRRLLVVARQNGLLESWDVAAMQKMAEWQGEAITAIAFSSNGASLAAGEQSGRVILFDMRLVGLVPQAEFQAGYAVNALAFAPNDPSLLYLAGKSHHVHLWNVSQSDESAALQGSNLFELMTLAVGADLLVAGTEPGRIVVWQTVPGTNPLTEFSFADMSPIRSVFISPDGSQVIFTQSNKLKVFDIRTKKQVRETFFRNDETVGLNVSPDGCSLAVQTQHSLVLLDSKTFEVYKQFETSPPLTSALAFSPDGLLLAAGNVEGGLLVWGAAGALQSANSFAPTSLCRSIPLPRPTQTTTATPRPSDTRSPTVTPLVTSTYIPTPPILERTLSLSDPYIRGEDVLLLQQRLAALGYSEVGTPDGVFGPKTDQAVRSFQKHSGLVVDGIVGPITWQRLFMADAARP